MTSERAVEALTADEEAGLRAVIDKSIADDYHYHPLTVKMLLATLDVARLAVARGEPAIDVERLAVALDSVDIDEFDTLGAFDSTGYATAILAALRDEP